MIAWIDLETTGLEPKTGSILEIAVVLTHDDLQEIATFQSVMRPLHLRGYEVMDDYVKQMHEKSGLLSEIYNDLYNNDWVLRDGLPRLGEVEATLVNILRNVDVEFGILLKKIPLGGNSVHFDRAWIREHMSDLEALFSHRNVDCSTLNELAKRWLPTVHAARPGVAVEPRHRALDDVRASIMTAKFYREHLFQEGSILRAAR